MSRSCHRATFSRRLSVGAHDPRQAADLLAGHRIALVRHGGGALLLLAEELLGLPHLGTLQMADLGGDLVQACWR